MVVRAGVTLVMVALTTTVAGHDHSTKYNYATAIRPSPSRWVVSRLGGGSRPNVLIPRTAANGMFPFMSGRYQSPTSPLLQPGYPRRSPPPSPGLPRLHDNELLTEDYEDYDGEVSPLWLAQSEQHQPSLESLQHLLEGEVQPSQNHAPLAPEELAAPVGGGDVVARGDVIRGEAKDDPFPLYDQPGGEDDGPRAFQAPMGGPESDLDQETIREIQSQLGLEGNSAPHTLYPGEHRPLQLPEDRDSLLISQFLSGGQGQYPEPRPPQKPLWSKVQLTGDAAPFPHHNLHLQGGGAHQPLPQQGPFLKTPPFQDYPFEQDSAYEDEKTFPSGPFLLPSTKDLISAFTHPELTQEGRREACHAQSLHRCGGRVISEFSHHSALLDPCRIREEFLDCMEQQRGQACEPGGRSFSHRDTSRLRDQVKALLWAARGCILGHSA